MFHVKHLPPPTPYLMPRARSSALADVNSMRPAEQAPATGLSAELRPPVSKARSVGRHELLVHNAAGTGTGRLPRVVYKTAGAEERYTHQGEKMDEGKVVAWLLK